MAAHVKSLSEMSPDEIAALSPEVFKELAAGHNDGLELRENARNRELEAKADEMAKLTDKDIDNQLHDLGMKEADVGALDLKDLFRAKDLHVEQERRHNLKVDKALDGLLEPRSTTSNEPFGKSFIPAVIEAVKQLPDTIREKMNPFHPLLKHDHETLLERIEREAREKGQDLSAAREQDRDHDRSDDLERW